MWTPFASWIAASVWRNEWVVAQETLQQGMVGNDAIVDAMKYVQNLWEIEIT